MSLQTTRRYKAGAAVGGPARALDPRHRVSRWVLSPIAALVSTGDETDTVDRLFVTKHVNDLRMIVAAAFIGLGVVFLVAVVSGWCFYVFDWDLAKDSDAHQIVMQRAVAGCAAFLRIFGPTVALFGVILAWAYQRGSNRLGIVDLFACEIDTLCRVVTVIDMVRQLVRCRSEKVIPAHFNSQENYFPILEGNSSDLQSLEASVVVNITAFYTFMKTVRDKFRNGGDVQSDEQREDLRTNLIYMLYLGLESGRKAMRDLVEFEPACTERTMVILISELTAYHFLRQRYRDGDEVHYFRLILRAPGYKRLVEELDVALEPHRRTLGHVVGASGAERLPNREVEWSRALLLWPELKARFEKLEAEFPMACIVEGGRIAAVKTAAGMGVEMDRSSSAAMAQGSVAAETSVLRVN
jgi:hypothetical protein